MYEIIPHTGGAKFTPLREVEARRTGDVMRQIWRRVALPGESLRSCARRLAAQARASFRETGLTLLDCEVAALWLTTK